MTIWRFGGVDEAVVENRATPGGPCSFWYAVKVRHGAADFVQGWRDTEAEAEARVVVLLAEVRGLRSVDDAGDVRTLDAVDGWELAPAGRELLREFFE